KYTYGYDAIGRRTTTVDPRTGTSTTHYNSGGQVDYVQNANGDKTTYSLDSTTGRLTALGNVIGSATKYTRYEYNDSGQTVRLWGDVPQPTETKYDDDDSIQTVKFGQRWKLRTFRGGTGWNGTTWPSSPGTADETTWAYEASTGLLLSKTDAASKTV